MTDPTVQALVSRVEALMDYAQTAQALIDLLPLITLTLERIKELVQSDPQVAPELVAAAERLGEASEAIQRAYRFASTRLDVKMES